MTDHPILFNSEMVRAILDGRKTQTRRVVPGEIHIHKGLGETSFHWHKPRGGYMEQHDKRDNNTVFRNILADASPYGVPGDLLWVREKWRVNSVGYYCREHRANHDIHIEFATLPGDARGGSINICGDEEMLVAAKTYYDKHIDGNYSPSIHMPKWACRNWLKVKSSRVERVQDIRWQDCKAEGIVLVGDEIVFNNQQQQHSRRITKFMTLWDSIYAAPKPCYAKKVITHYESFPWEDIHQTRRHRGKPWRVYGNPHVFVTEFERYEK